MPTALVVEDDADSRDLLVELVRHEGFRVEGAATLAEARMAIEQEPSDLLLLDMRLPDGTGSDLLASDGKQAGDVIVVTGHASAESALAALQSGAVDYLVKPIDVQRLRTVLRHVRRQIELRREVGALRGTLRSLGHFGEMVGVSASMQRVYSLIGRVAPTDASVLITGQTGTGKELAARTIHAFSQRRSGPFLALNCGAVPANLIESELFGHERGAFSGATRRHIGYFERAQGGTLLLDEITETPADLQVKLLRALESGAITRVGGEQEIALDLRMLAATNRTPSSAVRDHKLREDLLYRLRVFHVDMPPLREREGDIELLSRHFLDELAAREGVEKHLAAGAVRQLANHHWPGNVRELKNVLYSAFVLAGDVIEVDCLPEDLRQPAADAPAGPEPLGIHVGMSVAAVEKRLIQATLEAVEGNRLEAAELLGVSVKTLYNRLRDYRSDAG